MKARVKAKRRKARKVWLHWDADTNKWMPCSYQAAPELCASGEYGSKQRLFREVLRRPARRKR